MLQAVREYWHDKSRRNQRLLRKSPISSTRSCVAQCLSFGLIPCSNKGLNIMIIIIRVQKVIKINTNNDHSVFVFFQNGRLDTALQWII